MSWSRSFADPIPLPDGRTLAALADAAGYITKLPKQEHGAERWQNAMHVLIQAADHEGPLEFARLGILQALYPKGTPVYHSADKDPKWHNSRKLVRDR